MKQVLTSCLITLVLSGAMFSTSANAGMDPATKSALSGSINGEHRTAEDKARDQYRKPKEVLEFLGFKSDMTVVEIWPGGGWYSKILAPALQKDGKYYAATTGLNPPYGYQRRGLSAMLSTFGETPDLFRDAVITEFLEPYSLDIAPKGSADMILTFRNVHNLFAEGYGDGKYVDLVFQVMYDTLKPGGVLGIVDHRWPDPATEDPKAANGYLSVERALKHAKAAGFELAGQSDLLANAKDTHDHPEGVWTLPPSLALGDKDKEKYLEMGESDRFLLKLIKPAE